MATTDKQRITVVVAYPATDPKTGEALKFDMDYYLSKHMPLIDKVWGPHRMISWSIASFPTPDPFTGQPPLYGVQTTIHWHNIDDFKAAMADEGSKVTGADVANFSNVFPVIWTGSPAGSGDRESIERNGREFVYGQAGY